jgi:hypothetical protein
VISAYTFGDCFPAKIVCSEKNQMNAKFQFALFLLLTGAALAANSNPVVAHSFLIQGSDGNFYGTALLSSENPGRGGVVFSLIPAGWQRCAAFS